MSDPIITPAVAASAPPAADGLLAQLQAGGFTLGSTGDSSAVVSPPDEQLDALAAFLDTVPDGGIIPVPREWYVRPDGVAQPWYGGAANPASNYARALRARHCAAVGGDGRFVWISQWSQGKTDTQRNDGLVYLKRQASVPKSAKVSA